MKKGKKDKHFVHTAFYKGGMEALKTFIKNELKYPEEAKKEGIQGTVNLKFHVNHKGIVHSVKVISGLGYGCDEEAIRIVSLLKYEVPKSHKIKVGFQKKLNIHFRLKKVAVPKVPAKSSTPKTYSYTISSSSSKPSGYSYTISGSG